MAALDSGPFVWHDWLTRQDALTTYFKPKSVSQLLAYLSTVRDLRKLRMRAVGSGHSTSDVARPFRLAREDKRAGIAVMVDAMELSFAQHGSRWWRSDFPKVFPGEQLRRVRAGMTIAELNRELAADGLALANLGSYDGQTVIGAIATGTHGSGMATGSLADLVASIEMVTILKGPDGEPQVKHLRVEPADGPTDPATFGAAHARGEHDLELLADDDAFYSSVVGLGFFGIVTAVTLRVRSAFWLTEVRDVLAWPTLRANLPAIANQPYFDFVMSALPSSRGGGGSQHRCLITKRLETPSRGPGHPRRDARATQLESKMATLNKNRESLTAYLAELGSINPRFANDQAVRTFEDEAKVSFSGPSHHVFRTSLGDYILATSAELAVPFEDVREAVDLTIAHLKEQSDKGRYHLSPIGVRFSQPSKHYLAMQYGRRTCTIEAPILLGARENGRPGTKGDSDRIIGEMLAELESRLKKHLDVRMHHGQRNSTTRADLERYPMFDRWLKQYKRFNPFGIFSNAASARWGLDDR